MNRSRSMIPVIGVVLLMALAVSLVWVNYHFAERDIGGEGFSIQWTAIHSLVNEANSPYSDAVTNQIQAEVATQNSFTGDKSPRYTSPLYSAIVVLPVALINNRLVAHAIWLTTQLIAVFIILLIGQKFTYWKPGGTLFFIFATLNILSFHVAIPWIDGGLSLWAVFFLALAFLSIHNRWNEIGGIFLALAAIQPQMTVLVIVFTLFWAAAHKFRILVIWFFMSLAILSILGVFLVPDWIMQYIRMLFNYRDIFPAGNLSTFFQNQWPGLGKQLGWLVTGILAILVIFESWIAVKKEFRHFIWTACLVLVITQWIGIPMIPANFIGLILPLILVAAALAERWPHGGAWIAVLFSLLLFFWEWALVYFDLRGAQPVTLLNLLIPLPLLLLIGLYWVRWSAIRPKRFLIEELRSTESY